MRVLTLSFYTLLEGIRNRIFFIAVIFSVFLLLFSKALSGLSFSEQERILFDFSTASLNFCLILLTFYCGIVLFTQELQSRALMGLLSKPITRSQFIVGKYLGYLAVCTLVLVLLFLVLSALLYSNQMFAIEHLLFASLGILSDVAVTLAILVLFSTVTNSFLTLSFTIAIVLIGHSHKTVAYFAELKGDALINALNFAMKYFVPNYEVWNWKDRYYDLSQVTFGNLGFSLLHATLWVMSILFVANLMFRRRDCV